MGRERYIVMNYRLILRVIGLLLIVEATAMMLSMLVTLMTDGRDTLAFALAAGVTMSMGSFLFSGISGRADPLPAGRDFWWFPWYG